jgi:GT2 family glycosyltransferase/tetratricopeptide (TPR) repeat protein
MPVRSLFGPVTPNVPAAALAPAVARGECLRVGPRPGDAERVVAADATWEVLAAGLPAGWVPDVVVLWLPGGVPPGLWNAPVPLVGLAPGWDRHGHTTRVLAGRCDRVLTDPGQVGAFARCGLSHAAAAPLAAIVAGPVSAGAADRDTDVLALVEAPLPPGGGRWLTRLARLGDRYRVAIRADAPGVDLGPQIQSARLVVRPPGSPGGAPGALAAAAGGALLVAEAGDPALAGYLEPGTEFAPYTDADLESVVEHYLGDAEARRAITGRAAARLAAPPEALWGQLVDGLAVDLDALRDQAEQRRSTPRPWTPAELGWAAAGGEGPARLLAREQADPGDPAVAAALGAIDPDLARAARWLGLAAARGDDSPLTRTGLAYALARTGRTAEAIPAARHALRLLDRSGDRDPADAGPPYAPPGADRFLVAWEAAGWDPVSGPARRRALVRWRLHALLGDLTGELAHFHEAALAAPDLSTPRAALGCALARMGRGAESVPHLLAATAIDPLDRPAARACAQVLADARDRPAHARHLRTRQLLAAAARELVPPEGWFRDVPLAGSELASVVVLCCNELEYTRLCLESVLRHTRAPYELLLVDNGSTDATPAYLAEVRARPGPERVVVVRNESNRGYPAGVNQGLAAARGEYLVLLNNDVVVTPHWLDGLVRAALADWPGVGLAGAVTNYAGSPQQVEAGYTDLSGLDAFAAARRVACDGPGVEAERLTGFCLLVRRAVFEAIGNLDERFGLGFFDDDDLCRRARAAGFGLVMAADVYVHHFGSRTFRSLGVDAGAQLRQNLALFAEKWGPEAARGYRLPDGSPASAAAPAAATSDTPPVVPAVPAGRPRVSLTMIVKNEEENLPECLGPVGDLFDEVVVVDTGSTDRTRDVARGIGARVSEFPWVDSFAAARNAALDAATGDYAFWLDADDRLGGEDRAKLRALLAALPAGNAAYVMKCVCVADRPGGAETAVDHVRLFRRGPAHRWAYRVHEQILPALRRTGADVRWSDVRVRHVGYVDPALRRRKLDRDLRLLRLDQEERPGDPFTLFNLGSVYHELGDWGAAADALAKSLSASHPTDSIVRKLYALLAQCHRKAGDPAQALSACRAGRGHYPDDAELLFTESNLLRDAGDLAGAEALLVRLIRGREAEHFGSVDTGLRGHKARHNLAVLYADRGRAAEAEALWAEAVAMDPTFLPSHLALAERSLARKDWAALAARADALRGLGPDGALEADVLSARARTERGEFAAARAELEALVAAAPGALGARVALTHALLRGGAEPAACERALRAVLALDPNNAQARHNLEVLLRTRAGRAPAGAPA